MRNQQGKVCLVTGASSGIGMEIARVHAKLGGDLVLVARREQRLNDLKKELQNSYGVTVHVKQADLTNEKEREHLYQQLKNENIDIDYLVNNAGFGGHGMFAEKTLER